MTALNFPSSPADGDTFDNYIYDGTKAVWRIQPNIPGISSTFKVSATAPASPKNGEIWLNSTDGNTYIYYVDTDSAQWIEIGGNTATTPILSDLNDVEIYEALDEQALVYDASSDKWINADVAGGVEVSATAPASPSPGDLWWNSDTGNLFVYYDDGDSQQWVDAASPKVFVSDTAPTGYDGQLWLDSTDGSMYVYYTDPGGVDAQWIGAVSRSGGILQVVSTTKTDTFTTSSNSYVDVTGLAATITPRSTSSKILVSYQLQGNGRDSVVGAFFKLVRNSTDIARGDAAGSRDRASAAMLGGASALIFMGNDFLDSPVTTSSVTYKIQIRANTANNVYINRTHDDTNNNLYPRGISSITLMEVAG